jgi:mRNA-degrading endonuclease YafQ of YafQ-DinJ toxin-antitoxin module
LKIARTARFQKAWELLEQQEKKLARKAIANLVVDFRYPALNVKKMKGTQGVWEARVSLSLRITFEIAGDTIILRNIGRHDEVLGSP